MKKNLYLSRREEIVITTIDLIHELGIKAVSIKEIAKREGVTEASLYKHFKNKEEILLCVIQYYERYDQHIHSTLQNNHMEAKEKILNYFTIYAEYYSNYRQITSLSAAYDVLLYDKTFAPGIRQIIERKHQFIKNLVEERQKNGKTAYAISSDIMAYILLGTFERIIYMWRLRDFQFPLKEKTVEAIIGIITLYDGRMNEKV